MYPNRRVQAPLGIDPYLRKLIVEDLPSYGRQRFAFVLNRDGKSGTLRRYWGETAKSDDPYIAKRVQVRETPVHMVGEGTFIHGEEGPVVTISQKRSRNSF